MCCCFVFHLRPAVVMVLCSWPWLIYFLFSIICHCLLFNFFAPTNPITCSWPESRTARTHCSPCIILLSQVEKNIISLHITCLVNIYIVLTLITFCYVLRVCSSDQDSWGWYDNTLLCHLYRTPLHHIIQDSWMYVELQISRLIILCRVTSITLLPQIGTHSRALRGYSHGSLDFSTSNIFGFQVQCAAQVFFATSIVGLAPFLLDDLLISIEKIIAIQERRRRLHASSSCSHRWQQTCDQVNAI